MKAKVVKVNPSDLQSIMFEKFKARGHASHGIHAADQRDEPDTVWTVDKAKRWLKKNGFLRDEVDPGGERSNYLRFRQFNPESGLRYRSIPLGKGKGIMASVAFTGRAPAANPRVPTLQRREMTPVRRPIDLGYDSRGLECDYCGAHMTSFNIPRRWRRGDELVCPNCAPIIPAPGYRRNPSDDAKWAIGFVDRDGRNDRAVVYGADSNDAYRNFVRSYGRHRVFSIKRMESHFYGNPRRGYESEEIEKERELARLGQGQRFRHRDYEQPIGDPQLAGTRYRR